MNRYPLWLNIVVVLTIVLGSLYTVPNFLGDSPGLQISPAKLTVKADTALLSRVEKILTDNKIEIRQMNFEKDSVRIRFQDVETQLKAKEILENTINPPQINDAGQNVYDYVLALNLIPNTPNWMRALGAEPMFLGLDLRGGVHFLFEVDMQGAVEKRLDALAVNARLRLRERRLEYINLERMNNTLALTFKDDLIAQKSLPIVQENIPELNFEYESTNGEPALVGRLAGKSLLESQAQAVEKNINTLRNRVNELGVAEPIIQKQGQTRIVVQLPGVQDVAKAKEILGRTATLELRLATNSRSTSSAQAFKDIEGRTIWLSKQVQLTGDNLTDASAGFSSRENVPAIHLTLDGNGARVFRNVTRDNIGKQMAIILYEKGIGTVVTAPVIRSEIPNGQVEISGAMDVKEAHDTALLLRSGSLAAPMQIIEERVIGPSLGKENIERGFNATLWGFVAIIVFMAIYYTLFGVFSGIALFTNLLFLLALLSLLGATLTLPGIAAIALTLGMAIDANVLINERIREEVRLGVSPAQAIHMGYDRAFATILDSNITTLIAGLALLLFGSGPVRGFAIVHCLGILTSMYSSVVVSRSLVNVWYGKKRKIDKLAIGNTAW